ncbi:uncharacterized protein [Solanum tuberosum]|uniref:Uncharacterized protein n=1 Tax=Solanum tuberosum TaxID=4113 RepID=M1ACC2_SOLTU|nr:PREDICTED: uncharacterized protein LOC102599659 isoform X1 [Solanum tuberosum]
MESDDDYQSFYMPKDVSPEVRRPRFKRLKKALAASKNQHRPPIDDVFDFPKVDFSKLEALEEDSADSTEPEPVSSQGTEDEIRVGSVSEEKGGDSREAQQDSADSTELLSLQNSEIEIRLEPVSDEKHSEDFDDKDVLVSGQQCQEVKRSLEFGEDDDQSHGKEHKQSREIGEDLVSGDVTKEIHEEIGGIDEVIGDMNMEKLGLQLDEGDDKKKNKKKRSKGDIGREVKSKELASNKRREEKENKAFCRQLHVDTQRLLRESNDATFKPIPVVHKPISSVLEKIRKRKLEISKNRTVMLISNDSIHKFSALREVTMEVDAKSAYSEEQRVDKLEIETEGKVDAHGTEMGRTTETSNIDGISVPPIKRSSEIVLDEMALDERPNAVFRAPVDDTQDLFDDSEPTGSKDEILDDLASSPSEEVMAPSLLALNLKFDSVPPDESSSDEEDNDKENISPYIKGGGGSNSPKGDPVKAFVDDEAEEEDDSDNDLIWFGDNEDDDDIDDSAELHDIIATDYKEKKIDIEKRNELHQKWLEQQDAAGTENLLQRLKCGVEQKEMMSVDDELESEECEKEVKGITDMDAVPKSSTRLSSKKAKQIIVQMFVDKDDIFLSDEDEETEKRVVKQRILYNSEVTTVASPIEDESSSEIFGLIKKLNTMPDKRKPKASSFFDTVLGDQKKKSSLKSSFLGRVTNHLPSSHKQSSTVVRSFIFGRDDSNSRSSMSMSEDSSDVVVKENLPNRNSTTKFGSFQAKSSSQGKNAAAGTSAAAPLFGILKRSSAPSNVCSRDVLLDLPKPLLADLRVSKRSKAEEKI